jgi:hypothetical protein
MRFTPKVAQFPLGDLAFKVRSSHCTYSSMVVNALQDKVMSDTGKAILTSVIICPTSPMSSIPILYSALKPQDAKISQRLGTLSLEFRTIFIDNSDKGDIRSINCFRPQEL